MSDITKDRMEERDATRPAEEQGLFRKFDVRRFDGSDAPGGKHHGCRYFVLDVDHDAHAMAALSAYAAACEVTHPELAKDLREKWSVPALQSLRGSGGPRRRIVAEIKIGADSWTDLQHELSHLATEVARHGRLSRSSVSGGYSTGHIIKTSEDESITHDSWAAENEAYVAALSPTSREG